MAKKIARNFNQTILRSCINIITELCQREEIDHDNIEHKYEKYRKLKINLRWYLS